MQMGFFFDADLCIGCKACVMACKDKHHSPAGVAFRHVTQIVWGQWKTENGIQVPDGVGSDSMSSACNHCDHPACLAACPQNAIRKEEDGTVRYDTERCVSCRLCIKRCPYGAITFNKQAGKPQKCDLCYEGRQRGETPACVGACPMRCLQCRPVEELEKMMESDSSIYRLPDQGGTGPNFYIRRNRNRPVDGSYWMRSLWEEV